MTKKAFITGAAGFIGFHLAQRLLQEGWEVVGLDGVTDYYDVELKHARTRILKQHQGYQFIEAMLEDEVTIMDAITSATPNVVVHLAGQAGVRYSLENPRSYLNSNLVGTFNVMEAAKAAEVDHLMMASTSSVYGANTEMPYAEAHKVDHPLTFYAATKKANEAMGHSYAHLWKLPTTMFRFFTVYGPWGRPDMALFKFTANILNGKPIDIYNNGEMFRDFTYVEDLVRGIALLMEHAPEQVDIAARGVEGDSLSPSAPYRVVNIGNSTKVKLLDFVDALEKSIGVEAIRNYMPIQKGDVPATWADASLLQALTGYQPSTEFQDGIDKFVAWYREYYSI